jgi:hypothetical protein
MGVFFTDNYSLLHFANGILLYYFGFSFILMSLIHIIFEVVENSNYGMMIIRNIKIWPGGKESADTLINNLGDQFYASLGWLLSYYINKFYNN